jgi:hypothetical protein
MPPAESSAPDFPTPDRSATQRRAIFVYYKVAAQNVPQLRAAFSRAGSSSADWRRLIRHAELMRRAGEGLPSAIGMAAPQTWMEIYWLDDTAFADSASAESGHPVDARAADPLERCRRLIEQRASVAGISALADGERHYEAFESCA